MIWYAPLCVLCAACLSWTSSSARRSFLSSLRSSVFCEHRSRLPRSRRRAPSLQPSRESDGIYPFAFVRPGRHGWWYPGRSSHTDATTTMNGIDFPVHTFIEYVDDPADGLSSSDQNGITTDYKQIKVTVRISPMDERRTWRWSPSTLPWDLRRPRAAEPCR
jgi:hypothetical protein